MPPIEAATEEEHAVSEQAIVVLPPGDEVSVALADTTSKYSQVLSLIATGRELAERHKGVVADVHTVKGYEQIASIRTEFREKCRYPLQKLGKDISKTLGTLQRNTNRHIDTLVEEAAAYEQPFQEMLDVADARKEAERREREEAEQRRKDGHLQAIADIHKIVMWANGMTADQLATQIEAAQEVIVDEGYEEFQGQAQQAKDEAVRQLQGMLVAARADEEDRREAEEARQRQAAFAQAQAEAARTAEAQAAQERAAREAAEAESAALRQRIADMEAAQERQREEQERAARERANAIQRRIDTFRELPVGSASPAEHIARVHTALANTVIGDDLYGDRAWEAEFERKKALETLQHWHDMAIQREAEEAAAALRTQRNELLSTLVGMGENALLAVQDGSADVAQLEANRAVIADTELTEAVWGDLVQSAVGARSEALRKTDLAIEQTKERDRLAAEEAERQRYAEAERAAYRALADAKRSHGEELYEVMRRLVLHPSQDATNEARALLLSINPAETFED